MFDAEPEGWEPTTLGAIASLGGGTTPPKAEEGYWADGSVPWATPTDITSLPSGHNRISETGIAVSERALRECFLPLNPPGTVLMTSRATIGYAAINNVPMTTNQGFITFRCGERADPQFLLHWLTSKRDFLVAAAGGSTFKELSRGTAKLLTILLPPLDEQRRIVNVLRSVDETVAAAGDVASQAKRTHGILVEELFGMYASGEHCDASSVWPLGEYCERVTYGFTNPMPTTDEGPWMVTALNVTGGEIDYSTTRHTSDHAYETLLTDKSRPQPGSVLVTKDGTLGRVAVVDRPNICVNQSVAVLVPAETRLAAGFLSHLLQSNTGQTRMLADSGGGSVKHIYITKLAAMNVGVPSLEVQNDLASQADQSLAAVKRAEDAIVGLADVRAAVRADLLSGRVRVPA